MKRLFALTLGLMLVSAVAFGTWDDAQNKRVFPYFQTGGNWYTLLVFVNGSEVTPDVLYIRFCDTHGNFCSDTTSDTYSIRANEQLMFSTCKGIGTWIPTTSSYGYVKFRSDGTTNWWGDNILPFAVIYNAVTGAGYVIRSMSQPGLLLGPPRCPVTDFFACISLLAL